MIRIHAIQTGTVAIKASQPVGRGQGARRLLNILTDPQWTPPLPIYAWAIEHPEGVMVVDTGETARTANVGYFPRWNPYFRLAVRATVGPEEEIGPQLQRLGIGPRDVRWVVLTHFHTDHAGGLAHLPHAEILTTREDYHAARTLTGRINGFLPQHWPAWFAPRFVEFAPRPVGPFATSHPLTRAGDVHILPTPGHTPHHLSVVLQDGATTYFFAGDTSYTEQLMVQQRVDGVSPNVAVARQTLARIRAYAQQTPLVYLPSHDPQSAARLAARTPVTFAPLPTPLAGTLPRQATRTT